MFTFRFFFIKNDLRALDLLFIGDVPKTPPLSIKNRGGRGGTGSRRAAVFTTVGRTKKPSSSISRTTSAKPGTTRRARPKSSTTKRRSRKSSNSARQPSNYFLFFKFSADYDVSVHVLIKCLIFLHLKYDLKDVIYLFFFVHQSKLFGKKNQDFENNI